MNFGFSPQEIEFQKQVRQFMQKEITPEVIHEFYHTGERWGPRCKEFHRKLGAKKWLAVTWPEKYGGLNGHHTQRLLVHDEIAYNMGPYIMVGAGMAGPTILLFGTEEQKSQYLPTIAAGDIEFALGYTEPQAGSDLAALEIRAVEEGDFYVMNGQKTFNTACHYAEYHWLGARTDINVPKHKGVSLFIVDMKSPGITVRPLWCFDGMRTNEVFYDNVKVPKSNLVGEKNRGFYHIATALDFERMFPTGDIRRFFDDLVDYVKKTSRNGQPLQKDILTRQRLAETAIEIDAATLLAYRVAWMLDKGTVPNYESSMLKLYLSELRQRLATVGMQVLKQYGQLTYDSNWAQSPWGIGHSYFDGFRRTITAGTSEVQRNIMAVRGLNMPREKN